MLIGWVQWNGVAVLIAAKAAPIQLVDAAFWLPRLTNKLVVPRLFA
jgi:hypothetical protein